MAEKSAMLRARTTADVKNAAELIFSKLGLSATDAINMFYHQVALKSAIPFDVKLPNTTTRKTIEDARNGKALKRHGSSAELFEDLGINAYPGQMMGSQDEMVATWRENPKFKKAYDELEEEFSYHRGLLKARTKAGLTQEQIAQKMGAKRGAITRLEYSGKNSPSLKTLKKYAEAVGCKLQIKLVPALYNSFVHSLFFTSYNPQLSL